MARRTGLSTLHKISLTMCSAIVRFTPLIQQLYGSNAALMAALAAAGAACHVLTVEIGNELEYGD